MVEHKYIDIICFLAAATAAAIALFLMAVYRPDHAKEGAEPGYATRLFDSGRVHNIDIQTPDWEAFIGDAKFEKYISCTVVVDGEEFRQVGLRAKGNNSLRLTEKYGLSRYSLKLEFDHFLKGAAYHGLDKFSLDASFQDNSYLKTFLAYDMMAFMEVPSPLCSYAWVTVNGKDWGLFLAVEEPEESFAKRNFGDDYGKLYKPDYRSLNGNNDDVALKYIDDHPDSYQNIFEHAKFEITAADQKLLIEALRILNTEEHPESAVHVDEVLRYFPVQVFVMNWDSYLGRTGHNYYLYEEDGVLSILPWDYNLAFGTYALGMTDPIKDPEILINYPINTPADGTVMRNRPLYHNLMKNDSCFKQYHQNFDRFLSGYFENGRFEVRLHEISKMIAPYVKKDPTAFCSEQDHQLAVDTLERVCLLRAESIRRQLEGEIPPTIRGQQSKPSPRVDTSGIHLPDLGDFGDLESSKEKQDAALAAVMGD